MPWHIILSRATSEGIVALTVAVTGLLYLIKCIRYYKHLYIIVSVLLFTLTYFIYPSYRILIPLILLPVPFLFARKRKRFIALLSIIGLFLLLTFTISQTTWGRARFDQTSMFGTRFATNIRSRIQVLATEDGPNNVKTVKIYHNKFIVFGKELVNQYLTYFSPQYLFIAGGLPYRYSVADQGLLYYSMLPLLILALFFLRNIERRMGIYLVYLLLISPMPAPLTLDDVPNVHRTLFMIVPIAIFVSYGLFSFIDSVREKRVRSATLFFIVGIFLLEFIYFLHLYNQHANPVKSYERGDSNKEVVTAVIEKKNSVEKVYMPYNEDEFTIFYLYLTDNFDKSIIGRINSDLYMKSVDNIVFISSNCPSKNLTTIERKKNILVVENTSCPLQKDFQQIQDFSRHDGTKSYRLMIPRI